MEIGKEPKKILYLSTYGKGNLTAWSGSNHRIFEALSSLTGVVVDYFQAKPNRLLRLYYKTIGFIYRLFTGKHYQTGLEERFYPSIGRRTLKYLSHHQYDAIVCWQICFGAVFEQYHGKKIFYSDSTYHEMVPYYEWEVTQKQFSRIDKSQRWLLSSCDQFWCFSSHFIDDAVNYYGIRCEKIRSFRFFPTTIGEGYKKEVGERLELLLIGGNYYDKGVPVAVKTAKLLNERHGIKTHLSIVGVDSPGDDEFPYVTFYGRVNQFSEPDRFRKFFEDADVFILPTRHECAGIVFGEAASFGIPSVSYRTGGVPDNVEDGFSGYLLPEGSSAEDFADVISQKLGNGNQRRIVGQQAFTWYKTALSQDVFVRKMKESLDALFDAEETK